MTSPISRTIPSIIRRAVVTTAVLLLAFPDGSAQGTLDEKTKPSAETEKPVPGSAPSIDEVFLFQPAPASVGNWKPDDLQYSEVRFKSTDNVTLHGWYCPADDPVAAVLYLHGNAGNITHRARLMRHLQHTMNVSVLVFDYRGYGKSTGPPDALPTVKGAIADAKSARAQLAELAGVPTEQIVLMGRSLGGALTVQLAAAEPCRGLIIESSFSSLLETAKHHMPRLAWLVPKDKLNSAARIRDYRGPLLLSHGDKDRVVPYASGLKLFNAAHDPKRFVRIPGGRHNDGQSSFYYRTMADFLRQLPESPATNRPGLPQP